jgi:putative FmdB family regulatory protein
MPIYEYACKNCGHTLDELQKMSDDPLTDCPECGESKLKRLISAPRFRLKGEGWYETDFKKDNQRNLSSSDGETAKKDKKEEKADKKSSDSKSKSDSDSKTSSTKSKSTSKNSD